MVADLGDSLEVLDECWSYVCSFSVFISGMCGCTNVGLGSAGSCDGNTLGDSGIPRSNEEGSALSH
jgi:hypothetical protein